ncbi:MULTISPECIES: hypothetical protein [unclassified Rhodanobacter]
MSRVSDTRQRTREAAAQLVAGGKRSHEITVDQIYAAIQGFGEQWNGKPG